MAINYLVILNVLRCLAVIVGPGHHVMITRATAAARVQTKLLQTNVILTSGWIDHDCFPGNLEPNIPRYPAVIISQSYLSYPGLRGAYLCIHPSVMVGLPGIPYR